MECVGLIKTAEGDTEDFMKWLMKAPSVLAPTKRQLQALWLHMSSYILYIIIIKVTDSSTSWSNVYCTAAVFVALPLCSLSAPVIHYKPLTEATYLCVCPGCTRSA